MARRTLFSRRETVALLCVLALSAPSFAKGPCGDVAPADKSRPIFAALGETGTARTVGPLKDAAAAQRGDALLAAGAEFFSKGNLGLAADRCQAADKEYAAAGSADGRARALRGLGAALQGLGQYGDPARKTPNGAHAAFLQSIALTDPADKAGVVAGKSGLAANYTFVREYELAKQVLTEALRVSDEMGPAGLRAKAGVLNNLGNLYAALAGKHRSDMKYNATDVETDNALADQEQAAALDAYSKAASIAAEKGPDGQPLDATLAARALTNAAVAAIRDARTDEQFAAAGQMNHKAADTVAAMTDSPAKVSLLVTVGRNDHRLADAREADREKTVARAAESYNRAIQLAGDDDRGRSYALGYLGGLYETYGRAEDSLQLTNQALFFAQRLQDKDATYRWQWQAARLLAAQGRRDDAIAAYGRALLTLKDVKSDKATGFGNGDTRSTFRKEVAPIYYQAADLLLARAASESDETRQQKDLLQARDTIEALRQGELQDYLREACETALQKQDVGQINSPNTAIVYVIPLADRTEVVLQLVGEQKSTGAEGKLVRLKQAAPIGSADLEKTVENLRRNLERRVSNRFINDARKLHDLLIKPIEPMLQEHQIHTLVFVPDGALRSIPMGTLHDGDQYLIEKYAVAVTPGASLTEPTALNRANLQFFVGGISKAQPGFDELQNVPVELSRIAAVAGPRQRQFLDDSFTADTLRSEVGGRPYTIVHIASHGEFKGDIDRTFILTWNHRLTLNELRSVIQPKRYAADPVKEPPIDLLTLSACQTAAGDDRAALGLAGVAVTAGARSALASLWYVNDASSVELITEFYQQLSQHPELSKAQALRAAQLKLLKDPDLAHPIYWAPYIVIGNWL